MYSSLMTDEATETALEKIQRRFNSFLQAISLYPEHALTDRQSNILSEMKKHFENCEEIPRKGFVQLQKHISEITNALADNDPTPDRSEQLKKSSRKLLDTMDFFHPRKSDLIDKPGIRLCLGDIGDPGRS